MKQVTIKEIYCNASHLKNILVKERGHEIAFFWNNPEAENVLPLKLNKKIPISLGQIINLVFPPPHTWYIHCKKDPMKLYKKRDDNK